MKVSDLLLRCYAFKDGDQWVATCIDLDLAAQSDTLEEARAALGEQIHSYLLDAFIGEDQAHAYELITRKSPLSIRLNYHLIGLRLWIADLFCLNRNSPNHTVALFNDVLPVRL